MNTSFEKVREEDNNKKTNTSGVFSFYSTPSLHHSRNDNRKCQSYELCLVRLMKIEVLINEDRGNYNQCCSILLPMQQMIYIICPYSNLLLSNRKMNVNRIRASVNHYRNRFQRFDTIHHYTSEAIASRPRIFMQIYTLIRNGYYFVAWTEICFIIKWQQTNCLVHIFYIPCVFSDVTISA